MYRLLIIISLVLSCINLSAQNSSDSLQISVLTCASGKEIYAAFGHSAFRVVDKYKGVDKVYNYGTFSYKQPFFVLKFVRGFLNYSLSAYSYRVFEREYMVEGREVREQVLNLDDKQKQALYNFLEWNALPENKHYKYNFLEDNCATKIRDIINKVCGTDVSYPDSTYDFTLRDQINVRISDMPWFRLGVSLLMGLPVDRKASSSTIQFLPDYVNLILDETTINHDGKAQPVVKSEKVAVKADSPVDKSDIFTYISPSLVFWIIFATWALITYYEVKNNTYHALGDKAMLFIVGLFGILFVVMWFFTEHTVTAWNMNILWAIPTHIVAAFNVKKDSKFWSKYFKATAILTAVMLVLGPVMPQQYDVAFYPIISIILLRLVRIAFCKR